MTCGKWFVSTGFRRRRGGWWHLLLAVHRRWRIDYVKLHSKSNYRRLYIGPVEVEWSI